MSIAPASALLFCVTLSMTAPALAVYKCESGNKVSYTDLPCEGGKVLEVKTTTPDADAANLQLAQEKNKLHGRTQIFKE